jgi:glutamine amidotransferase PdxT
MKIITNETKKTVAAYGTAFGHKIVAKAKAKDDDVLDVEFGTELVKAKFMRNKYGVQAKELWRDIQANCDLIDEMNAYVESQKEIALKAEHNEHIWDMKVTDIIASKYPNAV